VGDCKIQEKYNKRARLMITTISPTIFTTILC